MENIKKILTKDDVINIIGLKGSGKTTFASDFLQNKNCIVVNCDKLLEISDEKVVENKDLTEIKKILKSKYGNITEQKDFTFLYDEIIKFAKNKGRKLIIEGNILQEIDLNNLKGELIILRISILKCYFRAVKRDYKNNYFMNLEKQKHKYLYKFTRFFKIAKRRLSIFLQAREIGRIVKRLEMME